MRDSNKKGPEFLLLGSIINCHDFTVNIGMDKILFFLLFFVLKSNFFFLFFYCSFPGGPSLPFQLSKLLLLNVCKRYELVNR